MVTGWQILGDEKRKDFRKKGGSILEKRRSILSKKKRREKHSKEGLFVYGKREEKGGFLWVGSQQRNEQKKGLKTGSAVSKEKRAAEGGISASIRGRKACNFEGP